MYTQYAHRVIGMTKLQYMCDFIFVRIHNANEFISIIISYKTLRIVVIGFEISYVLVVINDVHTKRPYTMRLIYVLKC